MAKSGKRNRIDCFRAYLGDLITRRANKKTAVKKPAEIFNPNVKKFYADR